MQFLTRTVSFGPRQFAYTPGRGARDVLALLAMLWVQALAAGKRIAVYCSDVSGAFDRVSAERLITKLKAKKYEYSPDSEELNSGEAVAIPAL